MTFIVNLLLTCILYCDAGPGCDQNCLQVKFITGIIFALLRFSSQTPQHYLEKAILLSRKILMFFLHYLIKLMFLELDVQVNSSFDHSSTTGFKRASLLTVLRVLDMPLFGLVQEGPWFRSSMIHVASVAGLSKILCTSEVASATRNRSVEW